MSAPKIKFRDMHVPADQESPEGMQIVYGDQNDGYACVYLPDIEYAQYEDRSLKINIVMPSRAKGPYPLLVYVQGSGWLPQSLYMAIPQLSDFAHHGYVVASVEYRHSLEATFPAQIQDVKTAIRYLRANADKYQIDPARVAVWGDSSGGHLSALVGVSEGFAEFESDLYTEQSSGVKAVVDFYGPTDLLQMNKYPSKVDHDAGDSPESLLIGGPIQEHPDKVSRANPITYISREKALPPFLIMHGDQDELVPFNQSVLLYEALKEAGQDVTFYKVKGAGHGSRFWTPDVLEIVRKFLTAYV
ncbi:alpha/beta hydrolase [Paenibacillus validus]|uniref:Alpha/beta hydrolase fold domain-containing protein n=1 Tax=Paenibacillus validus TaxID=44253 RepID=A0A7X2Z6U5_9BACL|nr:alpha/beta hydrolase [Paenibacillus validus]MUG69347.1 alpha/beta hydrolase fold domain-containing protein [Paenibacillus validus]